MKRRKKTRTRKKSREHEIQKKARERNVPGLSTYINIPVTRAQPSSPCLLEKLGRKVSHEKKESWGGQLCRRKKRKTILPLSSQSSFFPSSPISWSSQKEDALCYRETEHGCRPQVWKRSVCMMCARARVCGVCARASMCKIEIIVKRWDYWRLQNRCRPISIYEENVRPISNSQGSRFYRTFDSSLGRLRYLRCLHNKRWTLEEHFSSPFSSCPGPSLLLLYSACFLPTAMTATGDRGGTWAHRDGNAIGTLPSRV